MNTAVYGKRTPAHPIKVLREKAFDVQNERHPAREFIRQCAGSYDIKAVVEEDIQTLAAMRNVKGLIAFLCTLVGKDGRVLAQGRGNAILGPAQKFLQRAVSSAFNSAIADAMIRTTKVLDTFRAPAELDAAVIEEVYHAKEASENSDLATEKQRKYLQQLILTSTMEEEDRERWLSQMGSISKKDASFLINELVG